MFPSAHPRSTTALRALAASASLLLALAQAAPGSATEPPSQPTSQPSTTASSPTPADPAADAAAALDPLAARMVAFTGDPMAAERIAFTFTASFQTLRVFERSYVWRPQEGRLTVLKSQRYIEFVGIDRIDPSAAVHHPHRNADIWRSVAPDARPRHAARAWSAFINDRWWLMAPAFIVADGSEITVDGDAVTVFFATGGVTPGDSFTFTVDPDTGAVTSWTYDLHGGMHGDYTWGPPAAYGNLHLAELRTMSNDLATIRFEGIDVQ